MARALPSEFVELLQDAVLKAHWRKKALQRFLHRCHVAENALASLGQEGLTKRDFIYWLFPKLEATDAGQRILQEMGAQLSEMTTFPDLEGWEDSAEKKTQAAEAVAALRSYIERKRVQSQEVRDREITRQRAQAIKDEHKRREADLEKLGSRLNAMFSNVGTQTGGYEFEAWFFDLMDFFEITSRRPYWTGGRQIDGSVTIEGTTYIVELKFEAKQSGAANIDSLFKKVQSKADNTMGLLVAMSGYTRTAKKEASGARTPILLLDHAHIYAVLTGIHTFAEVVNRIRRHASQTGEAYLGISEFGG